MNRSRLNFALDAISLLLMLALLETGLVIRYLLPPGRQGGHGLTLWGWDRHQWGELHFWVAASLTGLMVVHVALHWTWVCGVTRRLLRVSSTAPMAARANLYGGVFLTLVLLVTGGLLWTSARAVTPGAADEPGVRKMQRSAEAGHGAGLHKMSAGARSHEREDESCAHEAGPHLRGSMTLGEAAEAAGVPVQTVLQRLDLPAHVPNDERIGRLARSHGLDMTTVRAALVP